jgi:hypothetical protein
MAALTAMVTIVAPKSGSQLGRSLPRLEGTDKVNE